MNQKRWMPWLAAVVPTLACTANLWAQASQTITFTLANNQLTLQGDPLDLKQGDTLVVEISNVTTAQATWSFTFDTLSFSPNTPSVGTPLRFESDPVPTSISGVTPLEFQDSSGAVQYDSNNSPPFIRVVAAGGAGATTPAAASTPTAARLMQMYDRANNEINLYFDEKGFLYQGPNVRQVRNLPSDVDDNDVINIFLVGQESDIEGLMVNVTGTFATDDINILGSSALADLSTSIGSLQGTGEDAPPQIFPMGSYGPYAPPSTTIEIKKQSDNSVLRSYTFRVVKNYIASFRFAVGRSDIRFNEFEVQTLKALDGTGIKNISDKDGEPRYFLNVVFYSWQFWNDRFWNGRDITETPRLSDRINPYVGIGLKNVGDEFLFGLSFEIARGLDFTWGVHVAKTQVLNGGFSEGDVFEGEKGDIPTKEDWVVEPNLFGFSVDLRVATQVLGSLFSGGAR